MGPWVHIRVEENDRAYEFAKKVFFHTTVKLRALRGTLVLSWRQKHQR